MKIAAKLSWTALATVMGFGLTVASGYIPAVQAGDASGIAMPSTSSSPSAVTTAVPGPSSTPQVTPPPTASGSTSEADKAKDSKPGDKTSDIPAEPPKVPDSVKGVVKRLSTATQDVTLEDLNSAREAVVKLDVLIDIEKRLTDLVQIRKDREEKTNALSGVIPASALGLGRAGPPALAGMPGLPMAAGMPMAMPSLPSTPSGPTKVEITKIVGASGNLAAVIKESDGKTRQIHVGEKMTDGSVVDSISRSGVVLTKDKKKLTIQVKDVSTVFGGR